MTLGELIRSLENAPPAARVVFDFCRCAPTTLSSWRGIYAELALGWGDDENSDYPSVAMLLKILKEADGKEYSGWKGGTYRMSLRTPVHIDNPGECTYTALIGVRVSEFEVMLITANTDE